MVVAGMVGGAVEPLGTIIHGPRGRAPVRCAGDAGRFAGPDRLVARLRTGVEQRETVSPRLDSNVRPDRLRLRRAARMVSDDAAAAMGRVRAAVGTFPALGGSLDPEPDPQS